MGMDTPEAIQPSHPQSEPAQVRDQDIFVIANNHIGNFTTAGYKQCYLSLDFKGDIRYLAGHFPGNYIMSGYSSTIDVLKAF